MVNLEQCKKAELYQGEQLLCEAGVTAGPTGGVLLTVPRSVRAGGDAYYTVKFYDAALGVLTCRCVLSSPMELPEDMVSLRCDIRETLEQLQRRLDGVTQSSLTKSLRELERDGFLHREVYQEIPPRVEYTLTDMGQSFAPILHSMLAWSEAHLPQEETK